MMRVLALLIAMALPACGPDAQRARAERTVAMARHALARVEPTSGGDASGGEASGGVAVPAGESAALVRARADAERWLEHSEQAVEVWGSSGALAFETMAPCLGRALGVLREQLVRGGHRVPESLRQAEALARTATERRCARRRSRADQVGSDR